MSVFAEAMAFVLAHEGGLSRDPHDPGGVTRYGISQRAYPGLDIAGLTREQAVVIYHRDYWLRLRCDELPAEIALALMDTAVNCGIRRAVQMLQGAINDLDGPLSRLAVDGVLGPRTLRAARYHAPRAALVAHRLLMRRLAHYARLARRERHRSYLRGWVARVVDLSALIIDTTAGGGPAPRWGSPATPGHHA